MALRRSLGVRSGVTAGLSACAVLSTALAAVPPLSNETRSSVHGQPAPDRITAPGIGAGRALGEPSERMRIALRMPVPRPAVGPFSAPAPRVKPYAVAARRAAPPVPRRRPPAIRVAAVSQPGPMAARRALPSRAETPLRAPPVGGGVSVSRRDRPLPSKAPTIGAAPMRISALPATSGPNHENSGVFGQGSRYRLGFASGASAPDERAGRTLDQVIEGLKSDDRLRLQLLAYAGGDGATPRQSRRLSLERALSVRSYLIDKGVRSARIDVRALGNRRRGGPPDRVDIVVTRR